MTRPTGTETWTTKDGQEIPIIEMADSHIENAMAMMERGAIELHNRGESDWEFPDIYWALKAELDSRSGPTGTDDTNKFSHY